MSPRRAILLASGAAYVAAVVVLSPARGMLDMLGRHGLDLDKLVAETDAHLAEQAALYLVDAGKSLD